MAVGNTSLYLPSSHGLDASLLDAYQQQFQLNIVHALPEQGLYLQFDSEQRLSLFQAHSKGSVCVDFVSGRLDYRRQKGGGELIAKAVNTKAHQYVIDATAGLGRDSFILASQGCHVRLFERHPTVAALLADGLQRALHHADTHDIASRMTLMPMSFLQAAVNDKAQVVYLDPMYPQRQKSAAVKKEMAYFHDLVGESDDDLGLLQQAARLAEKRVVVKRPRLGEFLAAQNPDYQYSGKSTRFDAYIPQKLQDALSKETP